MFVPTDEQGGLKMLLGRARATQHDEAAYDPSVVPNSTSLPPCRGCFPSAPPPTKPMDPYDPVPGPVVLAAPFAISVGWTVATLLCHSTSYNHFETSVGFMGMEFESDAASAPPAASRAVRMQPDRH